MSCDTVRTPNQTFDQRKVEVRSAIQRLASALAAGQAKAIVGPTGGVAFQGWKERAGVTDACGYRLIMVSGSALAKQAIQRAEILAGRTVSKQAIAHGHHSHDGGTTWHPGH